MQFALEPDWRAAQVVPNLHRTLCLARATCRAHTSRSAVGKTQVRAQLSTTVILAQSTETFCCPGIDSVDPQKPKGTAVASFPDWLPPTSMPIAYDEEQTALSTCLHSRVEATVRDC